MKNDNYKNWKEFINATLTRNKQFRLDNSFQKNQTYIEIYRQQLGDTETTFEIGYLIGDRLIYIHTYNDKTPGLNKNQIEYFNEHDFSENESYGMPGLDFNEVNQQGISDQLKLGIRGTEIIYLINGKPSFSKLTICYGLDETNIFNHTYNFENISIWTRLKNMFKKQTNNYQEIEINLKNIFGGLN
jgi:hypothetical protein